MLKMKAKAAIEVEEEAERKRRERAMQNNAEINRINEENKILRQKQADK